MTRINWHLHYRRQDDPINGNAWRWTLIGFYRITGDLWAHYVFETKPTGRVLAQTKRGKRNARVMIQ